MRVQEIRLVRRPAPDPVVEDFELAETELPAPREGELLVRVTVMSLDPYLRPRLDDVPSYNPPFALGEALSGRAVGVVEDSRDPRFAVGDLVLHDRGWRTAAVVPASSVRRVRLPEGVPDTAALGVLGMPGLTAWVGLLDIAGFRPGDTVWVSAAAGAVGSLVGQVARLRGAARVVGSAGGPAKVAHVLDDLGFDAAFDHRAGPVLDSLREAAPDGLDVYFDNVGGDHLEAALAVARRGARVALCGSLSGYRGRGDVDQAAPGPRNLHLVVGKRLNLRGFIVTDHDHRYEEFAAEVGQWVREGRVTFRQTVTQGLENAPAAFLGMLAGRSLGKSLVSV